ncbi:MAG: rod shape-determining protein MreC [Alphaproteobacteria bacterium]|nr:rod shape-determining protein MreC [Alphaproteobacteria bacterium]MBF0129769.1 rod shape-determining protein MreC [Alphaproteobacteria bacterium]
MKQPVGQLPRVGAFRSLFQRFAFLALMVTATALLLFGQADTKIAERMRSSVADALSPMFDVLSRPTSFISDVAQSFRNLVGVHAENVTLREENRRLRHWQAAALQLEAENSSLRSLLNFVPGPQASYISARVVAETDGPFVRSVLINAGKRDHVRKGQAVVTGRGVVGRVDEVGLRSARILLLTDINSRIPVIIEPSRTRAILVGNNEQKLRLIYLMGGGPISVGDRIITAEDARAFPPDLPVGVVSSVGESGVQVAPFVDNADLEYVRLIDYGLDGILDLKSETGAPE